MGEAGRERAGTTVEPRWLELERRCVVWVDRDQDGALTELTALHEAEYEQFRQALHVGEPIDVFVGGPDYAGEPVSVSVKRVWTTLARMTADGSLALEKDPMYGEPVLTLVRRRGVSSCALNLIEQYGKLSNEQTGDAIGRHRTLVAREIRKAMDKAIVVAGKMGIDKADLMQALQRMGNLLRKRELGR